MEVNPKQSDVVSDETYWKHLAVTNRDLELISKAISAQMKNIENIVEDGGRLFPNFSNSTRYAMQDLISEYLKLKGKIDLI